MGLFDFFKKGYQIELPIDFSDFPLFDGKIYKGPIFSGSDQYKRVTYFTKNIDNFENKILTAGFMKKSDVKYEDYLSHRGYIIIEKVKSGYKIAYHKYL